MDGAVLAAPDERTARAGRAALRSIDPESWRALTLRAWATEPIPVTTAQWQAVIEDSALIEHVRQAGRATVDVHAAAGGDTRAVGRRLPPAAAKLIDSVRTVRRTAADVLWFEPPDPGPHAAIAKAIEAACDGTVYLLDSLAAGHGAGDRDGGSALTDAEDGLVAALQAAAGDEDPIARVYGVSASETGGTTLRIGTGLRAAFHDRQDQLGRITMQLLGFARRDRGIIEELDGGLHPFALATDAHPLVAHRAAQSACDLIHHCAAADVAASAAAIVEMLDRDKVAYSTHLGVMDAQRAVMAATDADLFARAVGELYRAVSEGPLRVAAVGILRLLGEATPASAGLNEIRSRLLARQDETPLCLMIAEMIVPLWRNARAHEDLYWDPENETAVFGDQAVDLDDVYRTAERAWAAARGYQAGVALARGCLPELGRAIDQTAPPRAAIVRNIRLAKLFNATGLVIDSIDRGPAHATITLDSRSAKRLAQIGLALVGAAATEPTTERWSVVLGDDLPTFTILAATARLAAALYGPGPDSDRTFLYPTTFAPLLADALVQNGAAPQDAANHAWDLPLRDTITSTGQFIRQSRPPRSSHLRGLRRAVRRTNDAVHAVAQQLDLPAPTDLDLTRMCTIIRKLEQSLGRPGLRTALSREHGRLQAALGPPPTPAHPWAQLTA
ncbi:hypothetical protein AB0B74_08495 [Micromonospora parva]|uniref:hypothetical protein n=1 Tax=Micromonospora parva TaxID=1464048 RepID=UPI003406423F